MNQIINKLPKKPGVYIFKSNSEEILYIGKAKNIKKRVKDHYQTQSYPDDIIIPQINDIDFIITASEKRALILENELIKKFQPKYNKLWKDDKNYAYVQISQEDFPHISITHQKKDKNFEYIGPFVSAKKIKEFLHDIRSILPFRTCRTMPKKYCIYHDLELCPGYCIKKTKTNKSKSKKIISALKTLLEIYANKKPRIEGYDISNIQGQDSVGSMVVFNGSDKSTKDYRLFKIKTIKGIDDPGSMKEIISRRMKHEEWKMPELIIIDGGKTQISKLKNTDIPIIALAKIKRKYDAGVIHSQFSKKSIQTKNLPKEIQNLFLRIRNESHRFAITLHKKLRLKHAIQG
ncbi:MAG TPA: GIY-YIG nuclease family protein [Candidatus Pacearchaeota archaeon]|nr:GIY-YIG nuclease family protein [Candidatus Pacearchaeota archaeon]HPM08574.1 GIY-YIG nuclease family protein [Candidatus Pacearchaeota archaeon]HQI74313.1 GIY-YIG nuclease family protein [Candidatus Pacearchaeota archaeon]